MSVHLFAGSFAELRMILEINLSKKNRFISNVIPVKKCLQEVK